MAKKTISLTLDLEDEARLSGIARSRHLPHQKVERAKVILAGAQGLPVLEISKKFGILRGKVERILERAFELGPIDVHQ